MPEIEFSELPEDLRVKLSDKGKEELWHRVDEFGGIKSLSESFEFSQSKMYNWKNKDLAMPVKFVRRLMGQNATSEIVLLKGKGSSITIQNPLFPLKLPNEFLTRVNESVKLNNEGIPVYITDERSLVDRFSELLDSLGEVDYKIYSRESRFEVRYPKFLHELVADKEFNVYKPALVDETGEVDEDGIIVDGELVKPGDVEDKLYSRRKTFELALQKGDSQKITELMAEESDKVRKMIRN